MKKQPNIENAKRQGTNVNLADNLMEMEYWRSEVRRKGKQRDDKQRRYDGTD